MKLGGRTILLDVEFFYLIYPDNQWLIQVQGHRVLAQQIAFNQLQNQMIQTYVGIDLVHRQLLDRRLL